MTKQEFEQLAMKTKESVPSSLLDIINYMYSNYSAYRVACSGIKETKQAFVKRVFGGKVNNLNDIGQKISKALKGEVAFYEKWYFPKIKGMYMAMCEDTIATLERELQREDSFLKEIAKTEKRFFVFSEACSLSIMIMKLKPLPIWNGVLSFDTAIKAFGYMISHLEFESSQEEMSNEFYDFLDACKVAQMVLKIKKL